MSVNEERDQEAPVDPQRAASPGFSCVSMKSNNSMIEPPKFRDGPAVTSDPVWVSWSWMYYFFLNLLQLKEKQQSGMWSAKKKKKKKTT